MKWLLLALALNGEPSVVAEYYSKTACISGLRFHAATGNYRQYDLICVSKQE